MQDLLPLVKFYLVGFWERRWSILVVAWLACLAGWAFVATLPDRFQSTARIYVDTETIIGPLMKGLAITSDIDAQVEIMRRTLLSRPNLEQLVRLTDLDLTLQGPGDKEALVARLATAIEIKTEGRSLFRVNYENRDPELAYRVVNSILQIFVEQNLGRTQRDVDQARAFIDKQIVEYEEKLRAAELKVAEFQQQHSQELNGTRLNQQRLEQGEAGLRNLRSELDSAIWRRDQVRQQLASTPATLAPDQVATTQLSPAAQRLAALREQLDQLLLTYTDKHPSVISTRARLEQLERQAAEENGGTPGGAPRGVPNPLYQQLELAARTADLNVEEVRRRVGLVEAEVARIANAAALSPQVEADLRRFTRDYDVISKQYHEFIERREAAALAQRLDSETNRVEFRIVDPPVVPVHPSGPPHGLFMLGVFVAGSGAGFGVAVLRMLMNQAIVSPNQLQEAFGLPLLGSVSIVRSALHHRMRLLEGTALVGSVLALVLALGVVFYAFGIREQKPDLAAFASELRARIAAHLPAL